MANPNLTTLEANTINSLTNPLISKKISDNITNRIPLFYFINKNGNKELESGGIEYRFPIFKENAAAQAYSGATILNNNVDDPVSAAVLFRKQFSKEVSLLGTDLLKNSGDGPEAVINYITGRLEMGEEAMKNTLAGSSLGIFSSQADADLGLTGLQTMLPATYTAGTYAGLDRATYTYWQSQYDSVTTGFNTDGLVSLTNLILACIRGDEVPGIVVLTRSTYANLIRALSGTLSYNQPTPNTKSMEYGGQFVNFLGATCIFDDGVPANTGYVLNMKYIKLFVHKDRDMAIRDFITPVNQDMICGRIYWAGNPICNNLARQGHLAGSPDTWA